MLRLIREHDIDLIGPCAMLACFVAIVAMAGVRVVQMG